MNRRDALKQLVWLAAAAAGTAAPRLGEAAAGGAWGVWPQAYAGAQIPPALQAKNILEVFMSGGLSPWETFYAVWDPAWGLNKGWMHFTFLDGKYSYLPQFEACHGPNEPLITKLGYDANGKEIGFGPYAVAMRNRTDITDRLRVHVLRHDLMPHEAATPYGMTGYRFGSPRLAGLGAHIQRHYTATASSAAKTPYAYVFRPTARSRRRSASATAAGLHPGSDQPLSLFVHPWQALFKALSRQKVGDLAAPSDALLAHYAASWDANLKPTPPSPGVRSLMRDEYNAARAGLSYADELVKVLDAQTFEPKAWSSCSLSVPCSPTDVQMRVAARLLADPTSGCRYAMVFDEGIGAVPAEQGHDTHDYHAYSAFASYHHTWETLTAVINKPGENDPTKVNLDDTLVIVNTEFGRSPWAQNEHGRNHNPQGYVTLMFGGPVGKAQKGVVGAIDKNGVATDFLLPSETRAAALMALGIWPFEPEAFATSDLLDVATDAQAVKRLREVVLGVP